jgi:hypothetical protein
MTRSSHSQALHGHLRATGPFSPWDVEAQVVATAFLRQTHLLSVFVERLLVVLGMTLIPAFLPYQICCLWLL